MAENGYGNAEWRTQSRQVHGKPASYTPPLTHHPSSQSLSQPFLFKSSNSSYGSPIPPTPALADAGGSPPPSPMFSPGPRVQMMKKGERRTSFRSAQGSRTPSSSSIPSVAHPPQGAKSKMQPSSNYEQPSWPHPSDQYWEDNETESDGGVTETTRLIPATTSRSSSLNVYNNNVATPDSLLDDTRDGADHLRRASAHSSDSASSRPLPVTPNLHSAHAGVAQDWNGNAATAGSTRRYLSEKDQSSALPRSAAPSPMDSPISNASGDRDPATSPIPRKTPSPAQSSRLRQTVASRSTNLSPVHPSPTHQPLTPTAERESSSRQLAVNSGSHGPSSQQQRKYADTRSSASRKGGSSRSRSQAYHQSSSSRYHHSSAVSSRKHRIAYETNPAPATSMYWTRAPVHGSRPRSKFRAHSATVIGSDIWIFGGTNLDGCLRNLYRLDAETFSWSHVPHQGDAPPPTRAHSATAVGDRIFVIAGGDGQSYFNDTFYFDVVSCTWYKPEIFGEIPSPRRAHTAVYQQEHNRIVIFGGGNGRNALNDVFALDISDLNALTWTELKPQGRKPTPRGYHSMELVKNKCIVFGGSDGTDCFKDIFILDLDALTWTEVDLDVSSQRLSHTSTLIGPYLFRFGGHDGVDYQNDVQLFSLVNLSWETKPTRGLAPSARGYHTAVLYDSRLIIIGGFDGRDCFHDVHFLELASHAYLPQILNFGLGS